MKLLYLTKIIIFATAGPLFLISFCAYLLINRKMKKGYDHDLDDYYWEVEDAHPAIAKYHRWTKITLALASVSALLLFIAVAL